MRTQQWLFMMISLVACFVFIHTWLGRVATVNSGIEFLHTSQVDGPGTEPTNAELKIENLQLKERLRRVNTGKQENFKRIKIYCMVPTMFSESKFEAWKAVLNTWGHRCDILKFFVDPIYEEDLPLLSMKTKNEIFKYQESLPHSEKDEVEVYLGNNLLKRRKLNIPTIFKDEETGRIAEIVTVDMKRLNDQRGNDGKYVQESCWAGGRKDKKGNVMYTACRHIWEKVWRSWVYMHDSDIESADYFFKVDDDTFFFPDFVRKHAYDHSWDSEDTHYFGHHLLHGRVKTGFIAGAAVGYSRGTLRKAAPLYKTMPREYGDRSKFKHGRCVDRDGATQELAESTCLWNLNIRAEDTRDINGFEKVTLHPLSESMLLRRKATTSYWYWIKKDNRALCCSMQPIAFHHYKRPSTMRKLDNLLFNKKETIVMETFSDYERTRKTEKEPLDHSNTIATLDKKLLSGGKALGKYLELEYILHIREMLEILDLFDPQYETYIEEEEEEEEETIVQSS